MAAALRSFPSQLSLYENATHLSILTASAGCCFRAVCPTEQLQRAELSAVTDLRQRKKRMGRVYLRQLENENRYVCQVCSVHLSAEDLVISKSFHGRGGKAYLMHHVINVYTGK
jgi:hypothetical protein